MRLPDLRVFISPSRNSSRTGNQIPEPYIFRIWNASVVSRSANYLRLHPEWPRLRFRVPKWLAPRPGADQIECLELLPGFIALSSRNPGKAPNVDLRSRAPLIVRGGRQRLQRPRYS